MTKNTARRFTIPKIVRDIPIAVRAFQQGKEQILETRVGSTKMHLNHQEATKLAQELQDALHGQEEAK